MINGICLWFSLLISISTEHWTLAAYLPNVECAPYPKIVPVDNTPLHRYNPYFVRLQQCQGALSNPRGRACVPTTTDDISVDVVREEDMSLVKLMMSNHTECEFVCKLDGSMCNRHQHWDSDACECTCTTADDFDCGSANKYWSTTECQCSCTMDKQDECTSQGRSIDPGTCECVPRERSGRQCGSGVVLTEYVVVIVLVELVVVSGVWLFLFRFLCYDKRRHRDHGNDDDYSEDVGLSDGLHQEPDPSA